MSASTKKKKTVTRFIDQIQVLINLIVTHDIRNKGK